MAAFQEGSFDVAKRLTIEILTDDPEHAGARALRTRIEARVGAGRAISTPAPGAGRPPAYSGRGNVPEVTSVDPTMLIDRADRRPPEHIEPTVVVTRDDWERQRTEREPAPRPRAASRAAEDVSQPTVLISPKKRGASEARSRRSSGSFLDGLFTRSKPERPGREPARRPATQTGTGFWTPMTRGIVMAVAGLVLASLFVLGIVYLVSSLNTTSHTLTFDKPANGTIRGAGLKCGTGGSDCSVTVKAGETVQLDTEADEKYVFSGFSGDCPRGTFAMTQARTCGAQFTSTDRPVNPTLWPLTIIKPTGGTIVAAGGINCGSTGDTCTLNLPEGVPVNLIAEADSGHKFVSYTGDCEMKGETKMTGGRTCGATFIRVEGLAQAERTSAPKDNPPSPFRPRATPANPQAAVPTQTSQPTDKPQTLPAQPIVPTPTPTPAVVTVAPTPLAEDKTKPATPARSEVDHAKDEIEALVKRYVASFNTLDARQVKAVFPQANVDTLKLQFKEYNSLKCTLSDKVDYELIQVNDAGSAQLKFGMKQAMVIKVGGQAKTQELVVSMRVARRNAQEPWTIDWVRSEPKPKE
jgi:Divergent InlB B-repeat domain